MTRKEPVDYSEELADYICDEIASGRGLAEICSGHSKGPETDGGIEGMPTRRAVNLWLYRYPDFARKYGIAQNTRAETMGDEMLAIADDASLDWVTRVDKNGNPYQVVDLDHIRRSQLMVDARWKLMGSYNRSKYGNKVLHGGDPEAAPIRHAIEFVIVDPAEPADSGPEKA